MPRVPRHTLTWSQDENLYEFYTQGQLEQRCRLDDEAAWQSRLRALTSFGFHGAAGSLNVYQEARPRGGCYWYAYHTTRSRTRKRYLGPSVRVTLARLQDEAHTLTNVPLAPLAQATGTAQAPSSPQDGAFLATKLAPPSLPRWLVERARVLSDLNAVRTHPLTLVSASAGSGRTTLLSAWASWQEMAVAWLSLDASDNDPIRFWDAVIAALRTGWPRLRETARALLHSPEPPPLATVLVSLLNEVERTGTDIILILADYHVIADQAITEAIRQGAHRSTPSAFVQQAASFERITGRDSDLRECAMGYDMVST